MKLPHAEIKRGHQRPVGVLDGTVVAYRKFLVALYLHETRKGARVGVQVVHVSTVGKTEVGI